MTDSSLTLSQPAPQGEVGPPPACFIHLRQLGQLRGYGVCGVELQSGSRTMELYSGEDYIATSRGILMTGTQ